MEDYDSGAILFDGPFQLLTLAELGASGLSHWFARRGFRAITTGLSAIVTSLLVLLHYLGKTISMTSALFVPFSFLSQRRSFILTACS